MIILKVGGGKDIDWESIAADAAEIVKKEKLVVVHGANVIRDEIGMKLGVPTRTITSPSGVTSVHTTPEALDVFLMSYAGLANKKAVAVFARHGLKAVGLSGVDSIWTAKRKEHAVAVGEDGKSRLVTDNFTGRVESANGDLLASLLDQGYLPVLCPPALSYENEIVNVDNDLAVAVTAGALKADTIVSLFEAPGLLKNADDPASLVPAVRKEELDEYMQYARGRMKKKILGAKRAFELGVKKICWGDGRVEKPVSAALAGRGTVIQ